MKPTYIFTTILALCCTLPGIAQTTDSISKQVENAVERQVAKATVCPCAQEELTIRELIDAETELQFIRNVRDSNATFEKYPYLLNPVYRRHKEGKCPYEAAQIQPANTQTEEDDATLSERELIDAETELAFLRNTADPHATFDKYPYLLDTTYRRAPQADKEKIRTAFTASQQSVEKVHHSEGWKRKVGF